MKHKTKQRLFQRKIYIGIVYPLLVAAAICTMVPLLWLVSSSFKNAEEIFSVPIRWLPKLPPRITSSPYVVSDVYPKIKKPKPIDKNKWKILQPELENVLWEKAQLHIEGNPQISDSKITQELLTEMTEGIWQQTVTTLPIELWNESTTTIVTQVENAIIFETLKTIRENIYRQIAIETIEVEDNEFNRYKIDNTEWDSKTDAGRQIIDSTESAPIAYLNNDFSVNNEAMLTTTIQSPVPIDQIRRIILPVRGDASYHHLSLKITSNATTYQSTRPYVLDSALREETMWRIHGIPGELEASQITMQQLVSKQELTKSIVSPPDHKNRLVLTLTIHRPPYLSIVWNKLTSNYRKLWQAVPFNRYFINSVFIATAATLLALFFCSLGGFAFAKYQFRGKTILFGIMLASMMVPFQVLLVPLFGLMYDIGWLNSYNAIIFPFSVGAFGVFLMRQFIITIPSELLDAARIDGCSEFGIYYRIVLPIIKPALGALTIYTFLSSWNGYLWPLIVLRDEAKYTLPIGLANLIGIYRQDYGMLMAGTLLSLLPIVILFLAMQREFVQGITLGSVKE